MPKGKYISIFITFLVFVPAGLAQQVLHHIGGEGSESWDVFEKREDGSILAGIGFRDEIELGGTHFTADQRDVILAEIFEDQVELIGQLSGPSQTEVNWCSPRFQTTYWGGNAFSHLVFQADTLFQNRGEKTPFILRTHAINHQLSGLLTLDGNGHASMIDGLARAEDTYVLLSIGDSLWVDDTVFVPKANPAVWVGRFDLQLNFKSGTMIDGEGAIRAKSLQINEDRVFVAGDFQGAIELGSDSIYTRTADADLFLAGFDNHFRPTFLKHLRGVYEDRMEGMIAENDQLYLFGQTMGRLTVDSLEVIVGLRPSGFVSAFHLNGDAQWLFPVEGSSPATTVIGANRSTEGLTFSAVMEREIYYRGDTITIDVPERHFHILMLEVDSLGNKQRTLTVMGSPEIYLPHFFSKEGVYYLGAEMTGTFREYNSVGFFDLLVLTLDPTTSEIHPLAIERVKVYPNPVKSRLFFKNFPSAVTSYQVYNSTGQIVLEGRSNPQPEINVRSLAPGVYIWIGFNDQHKPVGRSTFMVP